MARPRKDPNAPRPKAEVAGLTFLDTTDESGNRFLMAQPADNSFMLRYLAGTNVGATFALTRKQARMLAQLLTTFARTPAFTAGAGSTEAPKV